MPTTQMIEARTTRVIIVDDARPAERYAAIQIFLGRQQSGWLPSHEVTGDDVESAIVEADQIAGRHGVWVGWSEAVTDPVEHHSGPISAIVAEPVR